MTMENVSDKLKLLDYGEKFCKARDQPLLERWRFAEPGKNPSIQFALFLDLCGWLMGLITSDDEFFRVDKFDDPNTSSNKLMLALRKLDFGLDFPTAKLKQAHGDAAVGVLDFLSDKAVQLEAQIEQGPETARPDASDLEVAEQVEAHDKCAKH